MAAMWVDRMDYLMAAQKESSMVLLMVGYLAEKMDHLWGQTMVASTVDLWVALKV
jgi:hypothetical protein